MDACSTCGQRYAPAMFRQGDIRGIQAPQLEIIHPFPYTIKEGRCLIGVRGSGDRRSATEQQRKEDNMCELRIQTAQS